MSGARIAARAGWLFAAAALSSCSKRLPLPDLGPHTSADSAEEVPEPPPEPVRVESTGRAPEDGSVWVDGHWVWRGRRWVWRAGSWQKPPSRAYYAPPSLVRVPVAVYGVPEGGADAQVLVGFGVRFLYVPGHWHAADGAVLVETTAAGAADAGRGPGSDRAGR
jgi:hypothetical protein